MDQMTTYYRINLYRGSTRVGTIESSDRTPPHVVLAAADLEVKFNGSIIDAIELDPVDPSFSNKSWTVVFDFGDTTKEMTIPIPKGEGSELSMRHRGRCGWTVYVRTKGSGAPAVKQLSTTVYAKTEFFNGTTLVATVDHTNASSIPTLTLDADVNDVKYQGSVVTSAVFTPLDAGLTATWHRLKIVGSCATTLRQAIPDYGDPPTNSQFECSEGSPGWTLKVETKPKVDPVALAS